MGAFGSPYSAAFGGTQDILRSVTAGQVGGSMVVLIDVWEPYRGRYLALFRDGIYIGRNVYAPLVGLIRIALPISDGGTTGSFYAEDAGQWPQFDTDIPDGPALVYESNTAKRFSVYWGQRYTVAPAFGDSQLSSIVITGAARGLNCATLKVMPTRAELSYSIISSGTTRIVRWWNKSQLVAEGSRVGDGALTCADVTGGLLNIPCSLTYSADIAPGIAIVQLRWMQSYQIHYSQSTLTYPRTPEDSVLDSRGSDDYAYQLPELASGSWNYNILGVDDEGNIETSPPAPADSPITIYAPPLPMTMTGATGSAAAIALVWTIGDTGCTYTVYSSNANQPVNFGDNSTPAPITTATDATGATLAAITDYALTSTATAYSTLETAFDAVAAAMNTAFGTSAASFLASVASSKTGLLAAIATYQTAIGTDLYSVSQATSLSFDAMNAQASANNAAISVFSDWQAATVGNYLAFLSFLGNTLRGSPGRYAAADGSAASAAIGTSQNLRTIALPFQKLATYRVIVRATKSGVQEMTDKEFQFTMDASGNLSAGAPADASLDNVKVSSSYTLNMTASVTNDDTATQATALQFFVVAFGSAFDFTTPQATLTLGTARNGQQSGVGIYTVGGNGAYSIAVRAVTAGGALSKNWTTETIYVSNDTPPAPPNISADVKRGKEGRV